MFNHEQKGLTALVFGAKLILLGLVIWFTLLTAISLVKMLLSINGGSI